MKKIIDVSEHQKKIDWTKVSGIDGVIIRIGYGDDDVSQDDDYIKYNLDECERLGIPFEVYLYSYADSDAHIQSEIAHIKRLLAGRNVRVWLDLEYRPAQKYWRKAVEAFLKAFPSGGVYSWEWVFTDILDGIDCPRWICAYGSNSGKPEADYKPALDCHGWQYTSKARRTLINASHNPALLSANHRGMNRNAPENTLPAFQQSKRYGFDYVETDIVWTSDGVPVTNQKYVHAIPQVESETEKDTPVEGE